jgi:UDP-glucose 4-epimerase
MTAQRPQTLDRVLVSGGSGMLGSHVVDRLLADGVGEVVVLDKRVATANLEGALASGRVRVVEGDIRDTAMLAELLAGADAAVHLAAMLLNAAQEDPTQAYEVNVTATYELLRHAARLGLRVVLGSSVGVYGVPDPGQTITEATPISARTFYGASKFTGELFARYFCDSEGLDYVALRVGTLFGDRQHRAGLYPGQLLSLLDRRADDLIDVLGTPDEVHDFLYVGDAADAVVAAVRGSGRDTAVNIVSGVPVTWAQVVSAVLSAAGSSATVRWQKRPGHVASKRYFNRELAERLLGFRPSVGLDESARRMVAWHDAHAG